MNYKQLSTKNDVELLKQFCLLTEKNIFSFLKHKFIEMGYPKDKIHYKEGLYLYIEGEDKYPTLVAHTDTVRPVELSEYDEFFYDREYDVLWSPDLAGFDDRAGVYAICKIVNDTKHKPSVLFLAEEEIGGNGAIEFINDYLGKVKTKFFVEFDRQGFYDSVFYNCKNKTFEQYINSFGFNTEKGIFSDVYFLCPCFDTAGVNLSIGYIGEHTYAERLYLKAFQATVKKAILMLDTIDEVPYFPCN